MSLKKKTPYLDFYKTYLELGCLPKEGLCLSLNHPKRLRLFIPTYDEYPSLMPPEDYLWGYDGAFHASFSGVPREVIETSFSPLRQTIVLFLAAMNNEL